MTALKRNSRVCQTLTALASATVLSMAASGARADIMFNSSGLWTAFTGNPGFSTGLNTDQLGWGPAFPSGSTAIDDISSYVFEGIVGGMASVDGSNFVIGDFTHNNFTIRRPSITGASLAVELDFVADGVMPTFNFDFEHTETPNNANPCAAGGTNPCPDLVSIPVTTAQENVTLGETSYTLDIVGFSQDGGSTLTESFLTSESQANTAELFGRLVEVTEVPAPATPLLIGGALLLLRGLRRRH